MDTINVGLMIIAVVEAIKDTIEPKYKLTGNQTRLVALVLGGIVGGFHLFGLTVEMGLAAGITAVGGHTLVSAVATKNQPKEERPLP